MTLIIPAAANNDTLPYIFESDKHGDILLYRSMAGIDLSLFEAIYITVLRTHALAYGIEQKIEHSFKRHHLWEKTRIVLLEESTCEPSTIVQTIEKYHISGSFMVKDADNYFRVNPSDGNYVCVYPLDQLKRVNPANKSYVELDYSMYITNIIEKRIIGRNFCVGGYSFSSATSFIEQYKKLSALREKSEPFFLSHIIFSMLLDGQSFRPIIVDEYVDWGTKEEWVEYKNQLPK